MSTKINKLNWTFWEHNPIYSQDCFPPFEFWPEDGYVSVKNAAYHIVAMGNSSITSYQVKIHYKNNWFHLRISGDHVTIFNSSNLNGATLILIPWPRNCASLTRSIVNVLRTLSVAEVHQS